MTVPNPETKVEEPISQNNVTENLTQEKTIPQPEVKTETVAIEDENFKAFREGRKKDRLEREAAEKRAFEKESEARALKEAMEALLNKPAESPRNHYQDEETEDQRIEKKVQVAMTKREAESERVRQEQEQREYPQRLQQVYSDFNQAINSDNLDYLEYHYPEVAGPLQKLPDGFEKWSYIYKAVKKFVPNINHKKDQTRAEKNYNMPKSMSTQGITQPGEGIAPHRLDEAKKAANWERMQKQLKGLG
jgi:hypothetical protein